MAILNKNFIFKNKDSRKAKQVLSGGEYLWERGGDKERDSEGEYGRNIMYSCM
jgi:hypothetical protein